MAPLMPRFVLLFPDFTPIEIGPVGRTVAYASVWEESPGSMEKRCRLMAGGGDPRDSATENETALAFEPRSG